MKQTWALIVFPLLLGLAACGSGSSGSGVPSTGGGPPTGGGGTGAVGTANIVGVNAGGITSGVDITVPAVSSAVLNAQALGTADITSNGGSASNTGGTVTRGTQAHVLVFGTGLGGTLKVFLSGPNDIGISNIIGIKSTKGTAGVEFDVTVPASAAPGARTVFLEDASGNITTFTGGLEVL